MEYQREDEGLQSLTGTVERVVFRNEENGWTVLELEAEDELHKVVGVLPSVNVGERLRLLGAWVEHASFGHQFRAEHCESQPPTRPPSCGISPPARSKASAPPPLCASWRSSGRRP